jgi:hypothetical protein
MSLLHAIETCLRLTQLPPSRFGRESVKDPRLVHDLRRGRQPGPAMERRVRIHIAATIAALPDSEQKSQALRGSRKRSLQPAGIGSGGRQDRRAF